MKHSSKVHAGNGEGESASRFAARTGRLTKHRSKRPSPRLALSAACLVVLATAACSSAPVVNSQLDSAQQAFGSVQGMPQVDAMAPAELDRARNALDAADEAWKRDADKAQVDHLAYLALQRAAITGETVREKTAEASIEQATATRNQLRLQARTRESVRAQAATAGAMRQADASERVADAAQSRADALEAELKALNAKQTDRGTVITIGDLLFDTSRAQLKSGALRSIDEIAGFFREHPTRNALIEGFTDSTGSAQGNLALSDRRAAAVRDALVERGVGSERIAVYGYGEAYPVAGNGNAGSRQMNRRVEIVLSGDDGKITPR